MCSFDHKVQFMVYSAHMRHVVIFLLESQWLDKTEMEMNKLHCAKILAREVVKRTVLWLKTPTTLKQVWSSINYTLWQGGNWTEDSDPFLETGLVPKGCGSITLGQSYPILEQRSRITCHQCFVSWKLFSSKDLFSGRTNILLQPQMTREQSSKKSIGSQSKLRWFFQITWSIELD